MTLTMIFQQFTCQMGNSDGFQWLNGAWYWHKSHFCKVYRHFSHK